MEVLEVSRKTMPDKYEYQELMRCIYMHQDIFKRLKPHLNSELFSILRSNYYKTRQIYGF